MHHLSMSTQNRKLSPFYFPQHLYGCYRYTKDLLTLDSRTPAAHEPLLPSYLSTIVTSLQPTVWADDLQHLPDRQLVNYLLSGIGFNPQSPRLISAKSNMQSALLNPTPVRDFLLTETRAGRILGPFLPGQLTNPHLSQFGVIPKRSQPGKWHLILDLLLRTTTVLTTESTQRSACSRICQLTRRHHHGTARTGRSIS